MSEVFHDDLQLEHSFNGSLKVFTQMNVLNVYIGLEQLWSRKVALVSVNLSLIWIGHDVCVGD